MGEILFITHRVPWPPNRGDKIRSYHIIQKLMEFAPVHLACFADEAAEAASAHDFDRDLASTKIVNRTKSNLLAGAEALISGKPVSLTSFANAKLKQFVSDLVKQRPIDLIFVFSGQMAQFVPVTFDGRLVMDFADVDSAKFESYGEEGGFPMAWIHKREGRMLRAFEKEIAARADKSLFVSEAEAKLFQQRSGLGSDKIMALGNGIDLGFYEPGQASAVELAENGPLIIFTGQMDYRPNIQAVKSFSNDVMPRVLDTHPDAKFAIVGRAPTDEVRGLDGKNGTKVIGAVDDIRSWLLAADVVVAPLRIARGIQNKVLEAMAIGKPVVASSAAAEGIDAVAGEHFLVATDPPQEAEMVCELLSDPEKGHRLGLSARKLIHQKYSWDHQLARLPSICGFENMVNAPVTAEAAA